MIPATGGEDNLLASTVSTNCCVRVQTVTDFRQSSSLRKYLYPFVSPQIQLALSLLANFAPYNGTYILNK